MMKRIIPAGFVLAALAAISTSCGTSLYRPLTVKTTAEALREETLIQLNEGNYAAAEEAAAKLWEKDKSNQSASLYSIALVSGAGVGLFDLITNTIEKTATNGSQSSAGSSSGNNVFNSLSAALPSFTESQLDKLKSAIEILNSAPDKNSSRLVFQRCLTAAIYSLPTINSLQSNLTSIQATLSQLPSRLGAAGGSNTCSASTETINTAANELGAAISSLGEITTDFTTALNIVGECFPAADGKDTLNTVSQQVTKLTSGADKGCSIPSNQQLGSFPLPSCLNNTITSTGGGAAVAGDGTIAGCELFINCTSGACF